MGKQQMEADFCSHRLANLALSGHSIEFHNKTNTKTIVTVHKPGNLHYNPITSSDIVVARYRAKNSQTWKVLQRNISAR